MSHHSINFKILCICILAFHACTHGNRQGADSEVGRIRLDFSEMSDTLYFSAFVDSVEERTLLLPDSLYLGESAQVYVDTAYILVTDWRQNRIYRFDGRGRFLNEIDRWGEGPEEYLRVSKVWTRDDVLYVYDNKGLKINTYTLEGDFKGSILCKHHFSDVEMLSDSLFVCFTPTYIHESPTGAWLMTAQGKCSRSLLPYSRPYPSVSSLWQYFYRTGAGHIGLFSPGTDSFLSLAGDSLHVTAVIDCAQPTAASFPGISSCWDVKQDFYNLPWFVDGEEWLLMCYSHFRGNEAYYALYDKTEQECEIYKSLSVDVGGSRLLGYPVASNLSDCLVTLASNDYIGMAYDISLSSLRMNIYHFKKR